MNKKWLLLFPALALALAGCNQGGKSTPTSSSEQETVKEVKLDIESTSIEVRQTLQLSANVTPVTLSDRTVTWSSNNEAVATVNTSGQVLGVTPGAAKIRATSNFDNTKYAECDVTVTKHYVAFEQLTADTENSYKFSCLQENVGENGTRYYFTGDVGSDTRGVTSASLAEAASVKLEAAEGSGKYHVSVTKPGSNEKKYFEMDDAHHYAIVDTPTAGREWEWNTSAKTVARTISGKTYFPGTYNSFTTISGCDIAQLSGDFVFRFVDMVEEADPTAISITEESITIRPYESAKLTVGIEPRGAAEAQLVWTVSMKDGGEFDNKVSVKDGVVTVAGDAVKDTEYNVKCTWGNLAGDTAVVKVGEKLNYGTAEAPLTPKEARAVIDASANKKTGTEIYVKGVVTTNTAYDSEKGNWGEIWLTDGDTEKYVEGYRLTDGSTDSGLGTLYKDADSMYGKYATMVGIGTLYSGTYEITSGKTSKLLSVQDANVQPKSISIVPSSDFGLKANGEKQLTAKVLPYGAIYEVEWSVKMKDGSDSDGKLTAVKGLVKVASDATVGNEYIVTATVKNTAFVSTVGVKILDASAPDTEKVVMKDMGYENAQDIATIAIGAVTLTLDKGSNKNGPKYYTSGTAVRCYGGNTMKFTCAQLITKITITFGGSDGSNEITADVGTWTSPDWTGSAKEVTLTIGGTSGNRRIAAVEVTYGALAA